MPCTISYDITTYDLVYYILLRFLSLKIGRNVMPGQRKEREQQEDVSREKRPVLGLT